MIQITKTEENYLRAIYKLLEDSNSVSTNALAYEIKTTAASVTDMIKKLSEKKLASYIPYHGVVLTQEGESIGAKVRRNQILWECFLVKELKFDIEIATQISAEFTVVGDEKLIHTLDAFLGYPQSSPNGKSLPKLG